MVADRLLFLTASPGRVLDLARRAAAAAPSDASRARSRPSATGCCAEQPQVAELLLPDPPQPGELVA